VNCAEIAALHRELGIPADYATARGLAAHVEADERTLVEIARNERGQPILLVPASAQAWNTMRDAASRERVALIPISGFRSVARQADIIRGKLAAGAAIDAILRYVAAPGFSEHHTGRALDIGSPDHVELDERFAETDAFRWLGQHAGTFGFRLSYPVGNISGIGYEPWHWCWSQT
jgi:zinc D-Ala-D-Ala carboxypeptidase